MYLYQFNLHAENVHAGTLKIRLFFTINLRVVHINGQLSLSPFDCYETCTIIFCERKECMTQDVHPGRWHTSDREAYSAYSAKIVFFNHISVVCNLIMRQ